MTTLQLTFELEYSDSLGNSYPNEKKRHSTSWEDLSGVFTS